MKKFAVLVAAGLVLAPPMARAAVTFEYLFDNAFGLAISYDGTVIAGNTAGGFDAFRWTTATGVVELGRSATQMVGRSAGTPGMSWDGARVASTIGSEDSTIVTSGLWSLGSGWQQLAPPAPPDAGIMDEELCSVWGMSGDGNTVVGLYWRPGQPGGSAHAYRWRQDTGMIDLGATARSSRANGVNHDGSVIAGFDEHPQFGYRRPCAWRNTTLMQLGPYDALGEADAVSMTGEWVGGHERNLATNTREAALWHWNGSAWSATQYLGALPGTDPQGLNAVRAISADGKLAIGYCTFGGDPFETTGFIWTDSTGMMDIQFWLADKGIEIDPNFDIKSLEAMTPDGKTLIGHGRMTDASPFPYRTFRIQLDRAALSVDPVANPVPHELQLAAAPNPVRRSAALTFTLPTEGSAQLTILDASGRVVRKLVQSRMGAGPHTVTWDRTNESGGRVGAGIYFARLDAGSAKATRKLIALD